VHRRGGTRERVSNQTNKRTSGITGSTAGEEEMCSSFLWKNIKCVVNSHIFKHRKFVDTDHPGIAQDVQMLFQAYTRHALPWTKEAFGYLKRAVSERRSSVSIDMKREFESKFI